MLRNGIIKNFCLISTGPINLRNLLSSRNKTIFQLIHRPSFRKFKIYKVNRVAHSKYPVFSLAIFAISNSKVVKKAISFKVCACENLKPNYIWKKRVAHSTFLQNIFVTPWIFFRILIRCIMLGFIFVPLVLLFPLTKVNKTITWYWWSLFLQAVLFGGPVLVKFGQWAATRRDIFSSSICQNLSLLQHQRRPHSWWATEKQLDKNFNSDWRDYLRPYEDDYEPVGSGCVAQVYKMQLDLGSLQKNLPCGFEDAEESYIPVALKVLHPGIQDDFRRDITIISFGATVLEFMFPSLKWLDLTGCVDNFAQFMMDQLDLRHEAEMLKLFNRNFDGRQDIVFPVPLYPFVSKEALLETWEDGCLISDIAGSQRNTELKLHIGKCLIHVLLKMVFKDNIVHGDLHSGNILFRKIDFNAEKGKTFSCKVLSDFEDISNFSWEEFESSPPQFQLAILDCGLTTQLSSLDFNNLTTVFKAVILNQGRKVAEAFLENSYHQCTNIEEFKYDMENLIQDFRQNRLSLTTVDVTNLLSRVFTLLMTHKIKLDQNYSSIMLAIIVLEGLGRSLDPNIDLIEEAKPYLIF